MSNFFDKLKKYPFKKEDKLNGMIQNQKDYVESIMGKPMTFPIIPPASTYANSNGRIYNSHTSVVTIKLLDKDAYIQFWENISGTVSSVYYSPGRYIPVVNYPPNNESFSKTDPCIIFESDSGAYRLTPRMPTSLTVSAYHTMLSFVEDTLSISIEEFTNGDFHYLIAEDIEVLRQEAIQTENYINALGYFTVSPIKPVSYITFESKILSDEDMDKIKNGIQGNVSIGYSDANKS